MNEQMMYTIIVSVTSIMASSGFWMWAMSKQTKTSCSEKMLIGLGHAKITSLGLAAIKKGYITKAEFELLDEYLYKPYKGLGGDGSAERIMNVVRTLPFGPDIDLKVTIRKAEGEIDEKYNK